MLRLLLYWHTHFIKGFFIQILSSVFRVTRVWASKRILWKGSSYYWFWAGILKYCTQMRFTVFHYTKRSMALHDLGTALGREKGALGCHWRVLPRRSGQNGSTHLVNKDPAWGASPFSFKAGTRVGCAKFFTLPSPGTWLPLQLVWGQAADTALSKAGGLSYGNEPIKEDYRGAQLASFLGWGSAIELKIERCWTGAFSAAQFLTQYISSVG